MYLYNVYPTLTSLPSLGKEALLTYLQTEVDTRSVEAVADHRGFSSELDLVRRPLLHAALCDHLSADILVAVERENDLLLLPRWQMAVYGQDIKHLEGHKENGIGSKMNSPDYKLILLELNAHI